MLTRDLLWELYGEWKRLTTAEGAAIRSGNWVEVSRCQAAKQKLQPQIIRATEAAKAECSAIEQVEEINEKVRERVNELILLESRNNYTLQASMEELEKERNSLEQTSSRLRQVHQRYVPPQGPVWNQYS